MIHVHVVKARGHKCTQLTRLDDMSKRSGTTVLRRHDKRASRTIGQNHDETKRAREDATETTRFTDVHDDAGSLDYGLYWIYDFCASNSRL